MTVGRFRIGATRIAASVCVPRVGGDAVGSLHVGRTSVV
jgi:hypothetical protein